MDRLSALSARRNQQESLASPSVGVILPPVTRQDNRDYGYGHYKGNFDTKTRKVDSRAPIPDPPGAMVLAHGGKWWRVEEESVPSVFDYRDDNDIIRYVNASDGRYSKPALSLPLPRRAKAEKSDSRHAPQQGQPDQSQFVHDPRESPAQLVHWTPPRA
jgi:hypothetical protein